MDWALFAVAGFLTYCGFAYAANGGATRREVTSADRVVSLMCIAASVTVVCLAAWRLHG